jgi:hypothetical protein
MKDMLEGLAEVEGLEYGGWWGRFIDKNGAYLYSLA